MKYIGIVMSIIGMLLSLTVLVRSFGAKRDELIARCLPDSILIKHSLWDECDGEPMNVWAEELTRRDEIAMRKWEAERSGK